MGSYQIFRSKVDTWLIVLTLAVFAFLTFTIVDTDFSIASIATSVLTMAIFIYVYDEKYIIDNDKLIVKVGHFTLAKTAIVDIVEIRSTHNPISSPALSLQRLSINLRKHKSAIIISPRKRCEFINALKDINPDIKTNITD